MLIIELTDRATGPVAINWDNVTHHSSSSSCDGSLVHLVSGTVAVEESYEEVLSRLRGIPPEWPKVVRVARPGGHRNGNRNGDRDSPADA